MKLFHQILIAIVLCLASCTMTEVLPTQGFVHINAPMPSGNDESFTEKSVSASYLDEIDARTFSIYFYYTRTGVLTTMPKGYMNPTPLQKWGEQNIISLYADTYDVLVANCNPYEYNPKADKNLPTLNPRRGVRYVSAPQNVTVATDELYPLNFEQISSENDNIDWNLKTSIINLRARNAQCAEDFSAFHSYQIYVGGLLMADNTNSKDELASYTAKAISVAGVQGYFSPLLSGESYEVRIDFSTDGITTKTTTIDQAVNGALKAGAEITIVIENANIDVGFGLTIESPNGETEEVGDIIFS